MIAFDFSIFEKRLFLTYVVFKFIFEAFFRLFYNIKNNFNLTKFKF